MTTPANTSHRRAGRRLTDRFNAPATLSRPYQILGACVIALSLAGFLVGTRETPRVPPRETPARSLRVDHVHPSAPSYREIDSTGIPPEVTWAALAVAPPAFALPDAATLLALKESSLARRASRRAYNGAPPIVPHETDQRSAESCLACHGNGSVLGDLTIPKMSHEHFANCLQCHAPAAGLSVQDRSGIANAFDGVPAPIEGQRAWRGAPPILPHATHMRGDCLSCHGPAGLPGLRSTHPERQSCLQCHAPSAALDQAPAGRLP